MRNLFTTEPSIMSRLLSRDEVRMYPREARLDNAYSSFEVVEAQVLLINRLADRYVGAAIWTNLNPDTDPFK